MRVLVTGGAGLLGSALMAGAPEWAEAHATRRNTPVAEGVRAHAVDLADAAAVDALLDELRPGVVIHAAVGTKEGERDIVHATRNVALACGRTGAALIHVSTDALLDGEGAPYAEEAAPAPVHAYGRFKTRAEDAVRSLLPAAAVARTSLIVRDDPPDSVSAWTLDALRRGERLRLFVDEMRCPIAADDLAAQLWEIAALPAERRAGVWHLVGPEMVSRFSLGMMLAVRHGLDTALLHPTLSRSHTGEPRPRDLRMLTTRADRELSTRPRPVSQVLFPPAAPTS